jgi:TolA-binding protein
MATFKIKVKKNVSIIGVPVADRLGTVGVPGAKWNAKKIDELEDELNDQAEKIDELENELNYQDEKIDELENEVAKLKTIIFQNKKKYEDAMDIAGLPVFNFDTGEDNRLS